MKDRQDKVCLRSMDIRFEVTQIGNGINYSNKLLPYVRKSLGFLTRFLGFFFFDKNIIIKNWELLIGTNFLGVFKTSARGKEACNISILVRFNDLSG